MATRTSWPPARPAVLHAHGPTPIPRRDRTPAPLAPPIAEVQGDSLAWALAPLEQLAGERGYSVVYRTLAKGHGGSCDPQAKVLTINDDQAVNARVDDAGHEIAHALVRLDRRRRRRDEMSRQ